MFDRIGRIITSGYRPGVRWCSNCWNNGDQLIAQVLLERYGYWGLQ